MHLMAGYLSRMICHRFDLPLPVFRGSKGRIRMKLSLQQLRRPYRVHTPLVSANAVIMWCMECIWTSYRMRLLDRAPVCMGGEGFYIYFSIAPAKVPFCPLFCSIPGSGYFSLILWLSMCLLCVCMCLCGCGVVWWGSSLSFSLDRRGDGGRVAGQQSGGRGAGAILQLPTC